MSLFLSRVVLDPRQRQVQRVLADCQALHCGLMAAFPDVAEAAARASLGLLYRLETHPRSGALTLLVQSRRPPDWSAAPVVSWLSADAGSPQVKPIDHLYAGLRPDLRLRFRLRANPTKRLSTLATADGTRPPGKRVDLRDDDARLAWLRRKGEDHGFALAAARVVAESGPPNVRTQAEGRQLGFRAVENGTGADRTLRRRMTFAAVVFEGELRVTDADLLRAALATGIGSGKAYGFGLLSVAPTGEG